MERDTPPSAKFIAVYVLLVVLVFFPAQGQG